MNRESELRLRLHNSLLAAEKSAAEFAYLTNIPYRQVERFLTQSGKYATQDRTLLKIEQGMLALAWAPPTPFDEPVSAGVVQALVQEQMKEQPQLSLEEFLQRTDVKPEEPCQKPRELTKEEKRFLTYAIWHAHGSEALKQALYSYFDL